MTTKEIEKLLGISKQTLIYYEKEGLIAPSRDTNNYRNYQDEDIKILKVILFLREMEISIDEIKLILNKKLSLTDCLSNKQSYLNNDIANKTKIVSEIEKSLSREKIAFLITPLPTGCYVLFETTKMTLNDHLAKSTQQQTILTYDQIDKIIVSLCARSYNNQALQYYTFKNPLMARNYGLGLMSHFYIDLDVCFDGEIRRYESTSLHDMKTIFQYLKESDVVIEDKLGLLKAFEQYQSEVGIYRYFERNLKKWHHQYGIDNYRGVETGDLVKLYQQNQSLKTKNPLKATSGMGFYAIEFAILVIVLLICFIGSIL